MQLRTKVLTRFTWQDVHDDRTSAVDQIVGHGGIHVAGLLDPLAVDGVRSAIRTILLEESWIEASPEGSPTLLPRGAHFEPEIRYGVQWQGNGWADVYARVQALEVFHLLPYGSRVLDVMRTLLGSEVLVHPRKIARIVYPHPDYGTPPHADRGFNPTPADVFTLWVPLYNCSFGSGTILVADEDLRHRLSGSEKPLDYLGQNLRPTEFPETAWQYAKLEPGDGVVFHSTAMHCTLPNDTAEIRMSADFRFQSALDPVHWSALLPHGFSRGFAPSWSEITRDWRTQLQVPHIDVDFSEGRTLGTASRLLQS